MLEKTVKILINSSIVLFNSALTITPKQIRVLFQGFDLNRRRGRLLAEGHRADQFGHRGRELRRQGQGLRRRLLRSCVRSTFSQT